MLPSASSLYGEGEAFVFQQDNAPYHKPNQVTRFLERSQVEVLQWPAQSRDFESQRIFMESHVQEGKEKQDR